jgi:heme/copper-type cytochrome/quinol oxidase subunit 3
MYFWRSLPVMAFLTVALLIAAIRSLVSMKDAYDENSKSMSIWGFVGGLVGSAFCGYMVYSMINHLNHH